MVVVGRLMSQETIREVGLLPEEVSTDTWVTQTSLDGQILHVSQKYVMQTFDSFCSHW